MKKIKIIFGFAALMFVASSCSKMDGIDGDTSFVSTAASGNLAKIFDISTDNSGNVKVTPIGNGFTSATINFGHGTGAAGTATITPAGSATHAYPEGAYTVTIISTDIAGKQTTNTYPLTITYTAPLNVAANLSGGKNGVAAKPTATGASSFLVYFGDVVNEVGTPCAVGGMVNHLYAAAGTYNVKVVAISGNATYAGAAKSEVIVPRTIAAFPAAPFFVPITFDDAAVSYFFGTFGGGQAYATVANPSMTGINTTASVGRWTRGWENWSGTYSPLSFYTDFATTKKIKVLVYNTDPTLVGKTLNCELEDALGGIPGNGVGVKKVALTTSGAWEELVFDFSTTALTANAKFGQLVFRFNDSYSGNTPGQGGQGTVLYIDNIRLTN
ncbi:MAG: hypothetical protein IPP48_12155 [Chitinophagaceae bacterium]|nr:hypothetical protein [Chitinophagaceae bacterium]